MSDKPSQPLQQQPSPPGYDVLQNFAEWWIRERCNLFEAPVDGVHRVGGVSVVTLYRQGEFQVQMAVCDPNSEITDHRHPGVELIKIYLCGEIYLRVNGQPMITPEALAERGGNIAGLSMRISGEDYHGALIGPKGGAFLTIQRHVAGGTKSLHLKWEGPALSEEHRLQIEA